MPLRGTTGAMSFKMGFITGAAVGYVVGIGAPAEQRARVRRWMGKVTDDPRLARTRNALGRNVGQVADTVTDQVTDVVDRAGEKVQSFVGDNSHEPTANRPSHVA